MNASPEPGGPWHIVPLSAEHTRSLAECHIACWREAYRGLVPDHVLDAFDVDLRAGQWGRIYREGPGQTWVALLGDEVIGFAGAGPPRDEPPVAETELGAMYVRATWYGTGVAHTLMRTALDPRRSCSLWVFERNPRARAFYAKYGFEPDGAARAERFAGVTEIRLVRPKTDTHPSTA